MPTIIDSLVIELNLDPSGMSSGAQQAQQTLGKIQSAAQQAAQNINVNIHKTITQTVQTYNQQLNALNQNLQNVSNQSYSTGQAVRRNAQAGAAGLAGITTSALGAYAALKALQGLYSSVTSTAAGGAALSRIIPEIGGSSGAIQSFAEAARVKVGADPAAVMEDLRTLSINLETFKKRGILVGGLQEMQIGGVNVGTDDTVESLLGKLSRNLASKPTEEAAMWEQRYQLSRDTGRFLRQGPDAIRSAEDQVKQRNLTKDQSDSLLKLTQAENDAASASEHLWRVITADLSKSGLASALEGLAKFQDYLSESPASLHAVETGITAVAAVMGVTLVTAITRLLWAINSVWALPLVRLLAGRGALAAVGAVAGEAALPLLAGGAAAFAGYEFYQHFHGGSGSGSGAGGGGAGGAASGANQYPGQGSEFLRNQRSRMNDEINNTPGLRDEVLGMAVTEDARDPAGPIESLFNRSAYSGKNIKELLHGGFYGPINRGQLPGAIARLGGDPAFRARMQAGLDSVIAGSNRLKGATDQGGGVDPNVGWQGGLIMPPGGTPGAIYNDFGGGPGGHAGAAAFREDQQRHVAMGGGEGTGRIVASAAMPDASTPPWRAGTVASTAIPPSGGDESMMQGFLDYNQTHKSITWDQYAQSQNNNGTTNNTAHTTNINSITVHTAATDANGIAGSLGGSLKQAVTQANTGLN